MGGWDVQRYPVTHCTVVAVIQAPEKSGSGASNYNGKINFQSRWRLNAIIVLLV